MKIIYILCIIGLLWYLGCNQAATQIQKNDSSESLILVNKPMNIENKEQSYSTILVNLYTLTLKNIDGKCTLVYKNERKKTNQEEESLSLDIAPPCEFIRMPGTLEPLYYTYGKKTKQHVLIVVGGPPHAVHKDQFQPNGCGTHIQRIVIFDYQIKLGNKTISSGAYCPSAGIDEVFFAT